MDGTKLLMQTTKLKNAYLVTPEGVISSDIILQQGRILLSNLNIDCDVEIDLDNGKVDAIVLPGGGRLFGLIGRDNEFIIPWERVKKIGEDIILVDMDERFIRKYFD